MSYAEIIPGIFVQQAGTPSAPSPRTRRGSGIWDECDFQCCCRDGRCIACELKRMTGDLPALLARADDACTCEERHECAACAIARVARRHPTTPAGIRRPADDAGDCETAGCAAPAIVESEDGHA